MMLTQTATRIVRITNRQGLHMRVCLAVVKAVERFRAKVTIHKGSQAVDAASIFGLMLLAATQGTELVVSARGSEAAEALEAVTRALAAESEMACAG